MAETRLVEVSVAGSASAKIWSQAQSLKYNEFGGWVVISLEIEEERELVDLSEIGVSIFEGLKESAPSFNLEEMKERVGKIRAETGNEVKLSLLWGVFAESAAYFVGVGEVNVYSARDEKVAKIYEGREEVFGVRGEILVKDKFFALTAPFDRALGLRRVVEITKKGAQEGDDLAVVVHKFDESSEMAGVVGEVLEEEREVSEKRLPKIWYGAKNMFKRPLRIKRRESSYNLRIGIILAGLLLLGIVFGVVKRERVVRERAYQTLEGSVTQKIEEAISIGDLNPERAKTLLQAASSEVVGYKEGEKDEDYLTKASELAERLIEAESRVFQKQEVSLNTLVELDVLSAGLVAQVMTLDEEGNVLMKDEKSDKVVGMSLSDKSSFDFASGAIHSKIALYDESLYGWSDEGVIELSQVLGSGEPERKVIIEPDELWGKIEGISMYAGNVYLLDVEQGEIWKYPVLESGWGARRRWLGAGIELDLSNVTDMEVDGDIWLVTSTGKLERYSKGVPVNFSMEGFPSVEGGRLSGPIALYLSETEVYVIEGKEGRIVVFGKDGKYKKQYTSSSFGEAKDLVVFEQKAYVLLQNKIVWFEL